jgi:RNA polymerase sigma-70 factor (ECF subfamily)
MDSSASNLDVRAHNAAFVTTHWSVVLAAREGNSAAAQVALAELCETYWYAIYAYVRRRGHMPENAADLTQGFFARFLQKNFLGDLTPGTGRFRSFLLACCQHFLANEWDKVQTLKRGAGKTLLSLDDDSAEDRYKFEPVDHMTPEIMYDRRWACTVLEQVLDQLRDDFAKSERAELFDEIKVFLSPDQAGSSYAEVGLRTGLKESAVKVAVHRMRRRYGELLRAEIAKTVADPHDVQDEVRHLIAVLSTS